MASQRKSLAVALLLSLSLCQTLGQGFSNFNGVPGLSGNGVLGNRGSLRNIVNGLTGSLTGNRDSFSGPFSSDPFNSNNGAITNRGPVVNSNTFSTSDSFNTGDNFNNNNNAFGSGFSGSDPFSSNSNGFGSFSPSSTGNGFGNSFGGNSGFGNGPAQISGNIKQENGVVTVNAAVRGGNPPPTVFEWTVQQPDGTFATFPAGEQGSSRVQPGNGFTPTTLSLTLDEPSDIARDIKLTVGTESTAQRAYSISRQWTAEPTTRRGKKQREQQTPEPFPSLFANEPAGTAFPPSGTLLPQRSADAGFQSGGSFFSNPPAGVDSPPADPTEAEFEPDVETTTRRERQTRPTPAADSTTQPAAERRRQRRVRPATEQ